MKKRRGEEDGSRGGDGRERRGNSGTSTVGLLRTVLPVMMHDA